MDSTGWQFFFVLSIFLVVVISAVLPKVINVVSTICFLVGYDHCTENCCRCANFFFLQRTAAICCSCADSGWDRLSSPPGRRELSCFSFKSSPSYDHLGSSTTEFAMRVLRKIFFVEQTAKLPSKRPRFRSRQKLFFKKKNLLKFKYWLFVLVLLGSLFSNQKIVSGTTLVLEELSPCYPYRVWNKY